LTQELIDHVKVGKSSKNLADNYTIALFKKFDAAFEIQTVNGCLRRSANGGIYCWGNMGACILFNDSRSFATSLGLYLYENFHAALHCRQPERYEGKLVSIL